MLSSQFFYPVAVYALLTAGLVGMVFGYRTSLVLLRRSVANVWPRSQPAAEPEIIQRAHDAHKNCVETFPLFLVAILLLSNNNDLLLEWGWCISWLVAMRVIQSTIHVAGTQPAMVFARGLFYAGQLLCLATIIVMAIMK